MYNKAKNTNTMYLVFELNYSNYLYALYKKVVDFYS